MEVVKLINVWEMYRIKFVIGGIKKWENVWALKDITLKVNKSESVGIVGPNGAGKTTLLKLIAGMLSPDRGEVTVKGRVSGLLELGAGFDTELTGYDNIYLAASMFGLTKEEITRKIDDIIKFADIGKFIYAPVKFYSQGMFVRLAFSIAVHIEPDIFLIDDTLAVGDEDFKSKCIKKIFEIKDAGTTLIFVTHDVSMLKRLCSRSIFLREGRILKDGVLDDVIPIYSQFVGEKKSIAALDILPLRIVFNKGRIFLNWGDNPITTHYGGYVSLEVDGRWYNSFEADWEVITADKNNIVAVGYFYQIPLKQRWKLKVEDGYIIKVNVENEGGGDARVREVCFNVMLDKGYSRWLTHSEEGDFPLITENNKDWHLLLSPDLVEKHIAVEANDSNRNLPSFIFGHDDDFFAGTMSIFNSDYLTDCRILQYKLRGGSSFISSFSIRMKAGSNNVREYITAISSQYSISNGKLELRFRRGGILIYYNGKLLTKPPHIITSFRTEKRWYHSTAAKWEVTRENEKRFYIKVSWDNSSLVQYWYIEIINESSFLWEVKEENNALFKIVERQMEFVCLGEYNEYFSYYDEGRFPAEFLEQRVDVVQRCIAKGEFGIRSIDKKEIYPSIYFKIIDKKNSFGKIFNSDNFLCAREVVIYSMEPEDSNTVASGNCTFKLMVNLKKENIKTLNISDGTLRGKNVQFMFDKGRGRIFCKGVELTKHLGFYTSLCVRGRWYDSYSFASWKILEKTDSKLIAEGNWHYIPYRQRWEIETLVEDTIIFRVFMISTGTFEVERLQTNIMLSEKYKRWLSLLKKGQFPDFSSDIDSDWDVVYSQERDDAAYVGVQPPYKNLPGVKFNVKDAFSSGKLNIVNSDLYHRARLLQWLDNTKRKIDAGKYLFCEGSISFDIEK